MMRSEKKLTRIAQSTLNKLVKVNKCNLEEIQFIGQALKEYVEQELGNAVFGR